MPKKKVKEGKTVRKPGRRDIDWEKQPLGEMFDWELADRLGVSRATVTVHRARLGIPCFRRYIDWDAQPLGEFSDSELARRLGVHRAAVGRAREVRGIEFHYVTKKCAFCRSEFEVLASYKVHTHYCSIECSSQ